jgi:hypothetical protein
VPEGLLETIPEADEEPSCERRLREDMPSHVVMVPDECNAAKAPWIEAMDVKPLPVGAPLPPEELDPHAEMVPDECNAANA